MKLATILLFAGLLGAVRAQEVITEDSVREVVTWLASDERRGRDTGSPQLEEAGEWLAARFEKAGLKQVTEGTWFHEFVMAGQRIDSSTIELKLVRKLGEESTVIQLAADVDARLWRSAETLAGKDEGCTVVRHDAPGLQRLLNAQSARRPVVIEVPAEHPYWVQAAGARSVLGGRRPASRPVFLVRAGLLPAEPDEGREPGWTATWSVKAPEKAEVTQRNVVGLLPGTAKKDEFVVVSAHYDHIGEGGAGGDTIHNGADDNATGTTATTLLAQALAKGPPLARSVLFVCFAAEERGLRGSAAFCEKPPVPLDKVVANLNLEMLGRPETGKEGKAWITGDDLSDFAAIVRGPLQRAGVEVIDFHMSAQLFSASDNWSFVKHGVVAHSLSAGSLHEDYHRPGDEVGKLDIPHMTRIIRALQEVVRELADRETPPAWNDKGKAQLQRQGR